MASVRELTKRFGGITAVDRLSFDIYEGEILGLIGPNGAGKSTVLNLLSGTLKPNGGRIFFGGHDITRLKPHKRCWLGISRTYQSVRPFLNLTVRQNVEIGVMFGAKDSKNPHLGAGEVIELLGLEGKEDKPVGSLNLFDRKKTEIAKAIATKPKLLMLDEPMAGLNNVEIDTLIQLLRQINREKRISMLIVEHVMRAIMTLSSRILVLHLGKKLAEGTPEEISRNQQVLEIYLGGAYGGA